MRILGARPGSVAAFLFWGHPPLTGRVWHGWMQIGPKWTSTRGASSASIAPYGPTILYARVNEFLRPVYVMMMGLDDQPLKRDLLNEWIVVGLCADGIMDG